MTTYVLCKSLTTTAAPTGFIPPGTQVANLVSGGALSPQQPPTNQTFQVIISGSGTVSGTVQIWASNDGQNWVTYGSAIAVGAGTAPQQLAANGSQPWAYYTAQVTALSGTNALATCTMNA